MPLEVALSGLPERGAAVLAHAVRPVVHRRHLQRQGQRLLRAPAGQRAAARARDCRRACSRSWPPLTGDRRDLPLSGCAAMATTPSELRTLQDWMWSAAAQGARRGRRGQLGRARSSSTRCSPDMARCATTASRSASCSRRWPARTRTPAAATSSTARQQYLIRGIGELRSSGRHRERDGDGRRSGVPVLVRDIAECRVGGVPRQGVAGRTTTTTSSTAWC
jgi:hypothetical protein